MVKEITVQELKALMDEKKDFQLIDVREEFEYEVVNMGATLIPLGNIVLEEDKISRDKLVVIHCRSGARSAAAKDFMVKQGFKNVRNLTGGVLEWQAKFS